MVLKLFHWTTAHAAEAIEAQGFIESAYDIEGRRGVHLCAQSDKYQRSADDVLFEVCLVIDHLDPSWLNPIQVAGRRDYIVPASVVNAGRRRRVG